MIITIALIFWLIFSFFLHIVLHESAHVAVALAFGGGPVTFWPFPKRINGHWTWGNMTCYPGKMSPLANRLLCIAPVIAEVIWGLGFLTLFYFSSGWIVVFAFIEIIYSCIDISNWCAGIWEWKGWTDGVQFANEMGWSQTKARLYTLFYLPYYLFIIFVIFFGVQRFDIF